MRRGRDEVAGTGAKVAELAYKKFYDEFCILFCNAQANDKITFDAEIYRRMRRCAGLLKCVEIQKKYTWVVDDWSRQHDGGTVYFYFYKECREAYIKMKYFMEALCCIVKVFKGWENYEVCLEDWSSYARP